MNIIGIIAEYNPFHNGHKYQIEYARNTLGADYVIIIMNGNFTQRGEAALINKYVRTQMALSGGADAVIELPVLYGTGSAEFFAKGGIQLLNELGCVQSVCFGSETTDIRLLHSLTSTIIEEPLSYRDELTALQKDGISYPRARMLALQKYHNQELPFLQKPNTILAIEYLKALKLSNSSIKAEPLQRMDSGYHSMELNEYSSATAIRHNYAKMGITTDLEHTLPSGTIELLSKSYHRNAPMKTEFFYPYVQYNLVKPNAGIEDILDINNDLSNRIFAKYKPELSYEEFVQAILNKQYTRTRIQRCLIHILLNIRGSEMEQQISGNTMHYARLLGFRKESSPLLREIRKHSSIPLLQKVAEGCSMFKYSDKAAYSLLRYDIAASDLYEQVCYQTYHNTMNDEYTHGVIIQDTL